MTEWHAMVEKDGVTNEQIHQVFTDLDDAINWASLIANYLGGRPATFALETCPVCRARRVSAMRASNI